MSMDVKALEKATMAVLVTFENNGTARQVAEVAVRAYLAALPPAPHGGAVAWLVTDKDGDRWTSFDSEHAQAQAVKYGRKVRPLVYGDTSPSPPQEQEAAPKGEAVAWRWRVKTSNYTGPWYLSDSRQGAACFEERPLVYGDTAPPSPKAEPEQEAVAALVTALEDLLALTYVAEHAQDHDEVVRLREAARTAIARGQRAPLVQP